VSPDPGGRHTPFVVQFARSLGQLDGRVVLVDADLEDGRLTRYLGLTAEQGLADCLRSDLSPIDALVSPDDGPAAGLSVLPVGRQLPMRSGSAAHVLSRLGGSTRVLVEAPALSQHQSLSPLLHSVDAVLVLVTLGRTNVTDASRITSLLSSLSDLPAATVVLSDRAEQPSSRAHDRSHVPVSTPTAASLPA
jgi:Mrp family chromosome partitioning ATPase